jgi:rubrerythrin
MPETTNPSKDSIIHEFETMKFFELSARDLYAQIAAKPEIKPEKIRTAFNSLAADEQRHADLVQEIIDIVTHAL